MSFNHIPLFNYIYIVALEGISCLWHQFRPFYLMCTYFPSINFSNYSYCSSIIMEPLFYWHVYSLTQKMSSSIVTDLWMLMSSSPDGKSLVFLSAHSSVNTGAHSATNSLHRIDWPRDGKLSFSETIVDVVRSCMPFSFLNIKLMINVKIRWPIDFLWTSFFCVMV